MTTPIQQALALGQSIWYDGICRSLLTSGELEHMVKKEGLRGMSSNPSIFDAAIAGSSDYSDAIAELHRSGPTDAKSAYDSPAIANIRASADIFRPDYDESGGDDGYVSIEVSPVPAHDTAATVAEAKRLWDTVDRSNLMVKVPGTKEGIPAIQEPIGAGHARNLGADEATVDTTCHVFSSRDFSSVTNVGPVSRWATPLASSSLVSRASRPEFLPTSHSLSFGLGNPPRLLRDCATSSLGSEKKGHFNRRPYPVDFGYYLR